MKRLIVFAVVLLSSTVHAEPELTVAATPVLSPKTGTYTSGQTVTITDSTSGAIIYYTKNGSTPTTASSKYTAAIKVTTTESIKAIAVAKGDANSAVASATYTIETPTATPVYLPPAGDYAVAQSVSISDTTTGATIYFTTNGSTPTTSSTKYATAIKVSSNATLKAIAVAKGHSESAVASASYTITPVTATPVFSPAGSTYATAQTVSITDATSGASIYYTTNGSAPTTSSPRYSAPIAVKSSETIKAVAIAPGDRLSAVASAAYNIDVKWTESILFFFDGFDGVSSGSGPVRDSAGNLYEQCQPGVCRLSTSGVESRLLVGEIPSAGETNSGVIRDSAGNFYGTTLDGGVNGQGSVYKISSGGVPSLLYSFGGDELGDASSPQGEFLLLDAEGNIYGTASDDTTTSDHGAVYKISPAGKELVLYYFDSSGAGGNGPNGSLVTDSEGNLYGTTSFGGINDTGVVFKLSAAGTETILHSFGPSTGTDGTYPYAGVIRDNAGNLYGTTSEGGANNTGTVFKISASGVESILHSFGPASGTDGHGPNASLIRDDAGNLYGTTTQGGTNNTGTVFEISASGVESILHSFGPATPSVGNPFAGTEGLSPSGSLILDGAGNLYGATAIGGPEGFGTIFKISP